jgi:hypothetical protein
MYDRMSSIYIDCTWRGSFCRSFFFCLFSLDFDEAKCYSKCNGDLFKYLIWMEKPLIAGLLSINTGGFPAWSAKTTEGQAKGVAT